MIDADYHVPFLAHTCMEPLNATVDVRKDSAEIWVGCQNPLGFRRVVADFLELDTEKLPYTIILWVVDLAENHNKTL